MITSDATFLFFWKFSVTLNAENEQLEFHLENTLAFLKYALRNVKVV
jgi:hypothetical protein